MLPTMLSVDVRRNYDMILERFGLRTLHSRWRHLDYCNVFNNKTDCQSIMDTVNLRVPSKLIRDFSILMLAKRWDLVLQLDARPWPIRFINLLMFLVLRLFRWMICCVMLFSLLLCSFILLFFLLYLFPHKSLSTVSSVTFWSPRLAYIREANRIS